MNSVYKWIKKSHFTTFLDFARKWDNLGNFQTLCIARIWDSLSFVRFWGETTDWRKPSLQQIGQMLLGEDDAVFLPVIIYCYRIFCFFQLSATAAVNPTKETLWLFCYCFDEGQKLSFGEICLGGFWMKTDISCITPFFSSYFLQSAAVSNNIKSYLRKGGHK